jgi:hypothetical protein
MEIASYISGFVGGEGCFCVSFQPSKRHRFDWEVRPSFSVSQNADRAQLLYKSAMKMNPTGKRKYSGNEILNSLRADEGIVCATGNRGIT